MCILGEAVPSKGTGDYLVIEGSGGGGPKIIDRDLMGNERTEVRGRKAMEGSVGEGKELMLDARVQWEPGEGCEEGSLMIRAGKEVNDFNSRADRRDGV